MRLKRTVGTISGLRRRDAAAHAQSESANRPGFPLSLQAVPRSNFLLGFALLPALCCLIASRSVEGGVLEQDRAALVALFEQTDGASWVTNDGWPTGPSVCEWFGVTCGLVGPEQTVRVTALGFPSNGLVGALPAEFGLLTALFEDPPGLDLRWNAVSTADPDLLAFLNSRHVGGDLKATQTIAPDNVSAGDPTSATITVSWTPISFATESGGYEVLHSTSAGGPYTSAGTTRDKSASSLTVSGLSSATLYFFVVRSRTESHQLNPNVVVSSPSPEVIAGTLAVTDLALFKSDGVSNVGLLPATLTYTIQVLNNGPDDVVGATVSDVFPEGFQDVTWTCTATDEPSSSVRGAPVSSCATGSISGDIADVVSIRAGGTLTYLATGRVGADSQLFVLTNVATVVPPAQAVDPDPGNNGALDRTVLRPFVVDSFLDLPDSAVGDGLCGADTIQGVKVCTLRAAIQESNTLPEPVTIVLAAGTYRLTLLDLSAGAEAGDLDVIMGKVDIEGQGADQTIIEWPPPAVSGTTPQPPSPERVFEIGPGTTVTIRGVTIRNGTAIAQSEGGGIKNVGVLTLERCSLTTNTAVFGAAIANHGILSVDRSTIWANSAVADNSEGGFGGAIYNDLSFANQGTVPGRVVVANSTISGNNAVQGAAIWNLNGGVDLSNVTVARNQAGGQGSAIFSFSEESRLALTHTLIAENTPANCAGAATVATDGTNLEDGTSCGLSGDDLVNTAAGIGVLQDNDGVEGVTLTHALQAGSAAIDGGDAILCPTPADQRGAPRFVDGDGDGAGACDIGAYEAPPRQRTPLVLTVPSALETDPQIAAYRMIGSPFSNTPPAGDLLVPALGSLPAGSRWRFLRYDVDDLAYRELSRDEIDDPFFDFSPLPRSGDPQRVGNPGFWLISGDEAEIVVTGTPHDASGPPVQLELSPTVGWQQVTSPLNFDLDWDGCVAPRLAAETGTLEVSLCTYAPEGGQRPHTFGSTTRPDYQFTSTMEAGTGYWFYLSQTHLTATDFDPTISIPPICARGPTVPLTARHGPLPASPQRPGSARGWRLQLSVTAGGLSDSQNYLGEDVEARDQRDRLDFREPPQWHGLALYFPRPEWSSKAPRFASDIRATTRRSVAWRDSKKPVASKGIDNRIWTFEVSLTPTDEMVELRWEVLGALSNRLLLRDVDSDRWIDLAESVYRYRNGADGIRRFEVVKLH